MSRMSRAVPGGSAGVVVAVEGPVTAETANVVLHRLLQAAARIGPDRVLQVDLSAVTELDAAGAGVLCAMRDQARVAGSDIHLLAVPGWARTLLQKSTAAGDPWTDDDQH